MVIWVINKTCFSLIFERDKNRVFWIENNFPHRKLYAKYLIKFYFYIKDIHYYLHFLPSAHFTFSCIIRCVYHNYKHGRIKYRLSIQITVI